MSREWVLLTDVGDWDRYREQVAVEFQVNQLEVSWGKGPAKYPCLAASYPATRLKIVSCYVYPADALQLIKAVGPTTAAVAARIQADRPADVAEVVPVAEVVLRSDFDKSVIAHLLTVVGILVDTGIIKPEAYEERYQKFRADTDLVHADDLFRAGVKAMLAHLAG